MAQPRRVLLPGGLGSSAAAGALCAAGDAGWRAGGEALREAHRWRRECRRHLGEML
ncbi:hypothetical protein [Pyrodictium abyssi]|uniref:hypothetical protein n=1 Tax=Pyrodictium abyssi TaxID=54256 RepID=UPI0030C7704D